MTFTNFACWTEEAVLAATPRDAASLSNGHFQAVHHPLRPRRRRLDQRDGGRWVNESQIAEALQGALRPDGYLFIPIVGGSGTGKSHLVRWVRDRTANTDSWESRYLPKNRTGIRQVIDIVIQGLSGPRIDAAREAVEAAPAHTEADDVLANRLLDELAILIEHADELPGATAIRDAQVRQLRDKLQKQLPDVLRDPVVRRKMTEDGAVIPRLVGLAMRGRQDGDGLDDDATRFHSKDLPLTFAEIGTTSEGARKLLAQMAGVEVVLDGAVALINEALPSAEKRIAVSTSVDLVEIFREVRRALHDAGKELVLFIEDFTVLHGVEREFLDAIVEPARSPDGEMCALRVIFAVTEGHFDDLDTVKTRCEDAYWLDAPYGSDGIDQAEVLSFLGRYLNAARLEPSGVETAWEGRPTKSWLPNACAECAHQTECHTIFGTSAEGYGLYPLNASAAQRFVEALSPTRFDPREVVRELINRFLLQGGADMKRSAFPSANLLALYDGRVDALAPLVASELASSRPIDHERVANVFRYWSERDRLELREGTDTAFGLDLSGLDLVSLGELGGSRPPGGSPGGQDPKKDVASPDRLLSARLKGRERGFFHELDQWGGKGQDLGANANRELRKLIRDVVLSNLEVGFQPSNRGDEFDSRFPPEAIEISGTATKSQRAAVLSIEQSPENAAALQALLLESQFDLPDTAEGRTFRRVLAQQLEGWTDLVTSALSKIDSDTQTALVEGLMIAAAVLGHSSASNTIHDDIAAMFESQTAAAPPNQGLRTQLWLDLTTEAKAQASRLRPRLEAFFGESRGVRGSVRALQADRLIPIVEQFRASWEVTSKDPSIAPLHLALKPAVDREWQLLAKRVAAAAPHLDRDRPWPDQTEKVITVLEAAFTAGRLPDHTAVAELRRLAATRPDAVLRSFNEARSAIEKQPELPHRVAVIASTLPGDVAIVEEFVSRSRSAMEGVTRDLEQRQAAGTVSDTEQLVQQVQESVQDFSETTKDILE